MKALMVASFTIAIVTAFINHFSPFSLVLVVITGIGAVYQYTNKKEKA